MSLTLKDLLKDFPHISLASEAENEEILEYYHQTALAAKESTIIYKREHDFFAFLKERSSKYLVFILRDDAKKIQGVAVASFRPGHINGQKQMIGYLGDLRVSLNRKLIREWRGFYGLFIEKSPSLEETGHCRYFQTALMSTNAYSKSNLADTKIPHLHYKELCRYQMINIIGKIGSFQSRYKISFALASEVEEIKILLQNDHQKRMFGHDWSLEFNRRLDTWKNFSLNNWITVRDSQGSLVATTCLWNPIDTKQIIVPRIPLVFKIIASIAKLIPKIYLKNLPLPGRPIDILYINQISFAPSLRKGEESHIFRAIIEHAFNLNFNMLAYCDFEREGLTQGMRGLITQKNQMGFFTVHYKDTEGHLRDELMLDESMLSPSFDMALV